MYTDDPAPAGRRLVGIEGVIDKDHASARLAADIDADMLVIATDVDALYLDWGQPSQRAVTRANPEALAELAFPEGSMGPKVQAACAFAQSPGRTAAIGQLSDVGAMLRGEAGTIVSLDAAGVDCAPRPAAGSPALRSGSAVSHRRLAASSSRPSRKTRGHNPHQPRCSGTGVRRIMLDMEAALLTTPIDRQPWVLASRKNDGSSSRCSGGPVTNTRLSRYQDEPGASGRGERRIGVDVFFSPVRLPVGIGPRYVAA